MTHKKETSVRLHTDRPSVAQLAEARFPAEHRKQSSTDHGQCLGGWLSCWLNSAGPCTLTEAGARNISSWLQCPPCSNNTSGGAKPGEGLSSGSWFKIKRSRAKSDFHPLGLTQMEAAVLPPLPVSGFGSMRSDKWGWKTTTYRFI